MNKTRVLPIGNMREDSAGSIGAIVSIADSDSPDTSQSDIYLPGTPGTEANGGLLPFDIANSQDKMQQRVDMINLIKGPPLKKPIVAFGKDALTARSDMQTSRSHSDSNYNLKTLRENKKSRWQRFKEKAKRFFTSLVFLIALMVFLAMAGGVFVSVFTQTQLALAIMIRLLLSNLYNTNAVMANALRYSFLQYNMSVQSGTGISLSPIEIANRSFSRMQHVISWEKGTSFVIDENCKVLGYYNAVQDKLIESNGEYDCYQYPDPSVAILAHALVDKFGNITNVPPGGPPLQAGILGAPTAFFASYSKVDIEYGPTPQVWVIAMTFPFLPGVLTYEPKIFTGVNVGIGMYGAGFLILTILISHVVTSRPANVLVSKQKRIVDVSRRHEPNNMFHRDFYTPCERSNPDTVPQLTNNNKLMRSVLGKKGKKLPKIAKDVASRGEYDQAGATPRGRGWFARFVDKMDSALVPSEYVEMHECVDNTARLLQNLARFLPVNLITTMMKESGELQRGMQYKNVTIHFTDIEGSTGIAEKLRDTPELEQKLKNEFVSELSNVAEKCYGTVDKWIGDCIMTIFGAPANIPGHYVWAVHASFMQDLRLKTLNENWKRFNIPHVRIRHGFATGEAFVGIMGGEDREQFTATGHIPNMASRYEGLNKAFGTYRLCDHDMYMQIKDFFLCRLLDKATVAGIKTSEGVRVYEILGYLRGPKDVEIKKIMGDYIFCTEGQKQAAKQYSSAVETYLQGDFSKAHQEFSNYRRMYYDTTNQDSALDMMLERCAKFFRDPPPAGWDGSTAYDK